MSFVLNGSSSERRNRQLSAQSPSSPSFSSKIGHLPSSHSNHDTTRASSSSTTTGRSVDLLKIRGPVLSGGAMLSGSGGNGSITAGLGAGLGTGYNGSSSSRSSTAGYSYICASSPPSSVEPVRSGDYCCESRSAVVYDSVSRAYSPCSFSRNRDALLRAHRHNQPSSDMFYSTSPPPSPSSQTASLTTQQAVGSSISPSLSRNQPPSGSRSQNNNPIATTGSIESSRTTHQTATNGPAVKRAATELPNQISINTTSQPTSLTVANFKSELNGNPLYAKMSAVASESTVGSQSQLRKNEEDHENESAKTPDSYVGFASLPDQLHRRAVKKGFSFNLMVVGESGLGKSTFINSLFLSELYNTSKRGVSAGMDSTLPRSTSTKTIQVRTSKMNLTENSVSLNLTLIDTPGFGDALDNSGCWEPIVKFIDERFEEYLNDETRVNRNLPIPDNRVHCCLYFIAPTGHGLRSVDIELMKRLDSKVNLVPLIAKADTMTSDELVKFKQTVRQDLAREKIMIFDFVTCNPLEQLDANNCSLHGSGLTLSKHPQQQRPPVTSPFAVVGSNCVVEKDGSLIRGREYPWGFVNVENTDHCDFIPLRKLLIRTHMYDIKDKTHRLHYEAYRLKRLSEADQLHSDQAGEQTANRTLLSQIEEETRCYEQKLKRMEEEMQHVFDQKVKEKMKKLEETRLNVQKTKDNYKKAIEEETKRVDAKRSELEKDNKNDTDYVSLKSEHSNTLGKQRKSLF